MPEPNSIFPKERDDKEVLIESSSRATSFISWLLAHLVGTAQFIIRACPPPVFLCFPLSACVPGGEEREEVAFMGTSYPRLEHSPIPQPRRVLLLVKPRISHASGCAVCF